MTLRKLWLLILVLVSVIAISANALVLSFLTDRYFSDYLKESYELHVTQLIEYTSAALSSEDISYSQMAIELESHINDPIIEIKLYDTEGRLLIDVGSDTYLNTPMMGMMGETIDLSTQETRQIEITSEGTVLGIMNITIHSLAENSFVARRFKSSLLVNSLFSIGIAAMVAIFIGVVVSSRMSRSLKETQKLASDIQLGKDVKVFGSGIKEVNSIQESLLELNARLRLKQKTRKSLVDQLVHQTRTPLTILQTHLEAIEDGVIEVDENELEVCQNQISDIKSIISNMSSMIDAGIEKDEIRVEQFDVYSLLEQIEQGLMAQFKKKRIQLTLSSDEKVLVRTDKYKLSQAIYNILTNAYKYTDANGVVRISYLKFDDRLAIRIQDTGRGIRESELNRIFDAYYRSADPTETQGDGLGLFIVKENIEAIGGHVKVQSKLGNGTTFTIELPLEIEKE